MLIRASHPPLFWCPAETTYRRCRRSLRGRVAARILRARPTVAPRIAARTSQFTLRGPCRHGVPQWGPREPPQGHGRPIPPCRPPTPGWVENPRSLRILVPARSVKSTPLRNPGGPRRGCAAGQHAQHFGLFIPRHKTPSAAR